MEEKQMKKALALSLILICVLGLAACNQHDKQGEESIVNDTVLGAKENSTQSQSQFEIPESIEKVYVSFYSMGQVTEWELDESKLPSWIEWAENLSLKPLSDKKVKELQMTEGGESYHFEINDDEMSFTFMDGGSDKYLVMEKTYYEVLNGVIPDVMPAE